jgi:hypothetical protein
MHSMTKAPRRGCSGEESGYATAYIPNRIPTPSCGHKWGKVISEAANNHPLSYFLAEDCCCLQSCVTLAMCDTSYLPAGINKGYNARYLGTFQLTLEMTSWDDVSNELVFLVRLESATD